MRWLLYAGGVIAVLVLAAAAYIYAPGGRERLEGRFAVPAFAAVDFPTLRKTDKPNQFLVCPDKLCAEKPDVTAPVFQASAADLRAALAGIILAGPDTSRRGADEALLQDDYVQRTALMRYPDLITVRILPLAEGQATLAIYSRSVYGYSDRGVNAARVKPWLAQLRERFPLVE